jgi:hypothetical protein
MNCRGGLTNCTGACVNPQSNVLHCGGCGNDCNRDEVCVNGRCRNYVAPAGCTACPCACPSGNACCPAPVGTAGVCVEGGACPM